MNEQIQHHPLPLAGTRVLDLTAIVLGPLATLCLADLGADVVKVEPPEGDGIRNAGASRNAGMGSIYLTLNRDKRSLSLDLKRPEARTVLEKLAVWADVVVHNMRPEAAARLGIDYTTLSALNPRLVYCSASGFAAGSDRARDPAVDDVIQAGSGLAALFGQDGSPPRYAPTLIADKVSGLIACQAILAALLAREKSGRGQQISVPMAETVSAFVLLEHLGGLAFDPPVAGAGYGRLLTPHRRPIATLDGYIAMTPYTKRDWQSFFRAAGREELCDDPRVVDNKRRNDEIGDLYALLGDILRERPTSEWIEIARAAGIPVSAVRSLDDIIADRGLYEAGYLMEVDHPSEGKTVGVGPLVSWPDKAEGAPRPAPNLGEHSREILDEIGLNRQTVDELVSSGVVRQFR
ncbi:MAG: CaiB/BaiF CoA transferase family protein [Flavobacteriaceae bacterium]